MSETKFRVWDDIAKRMFYPEQHARYCITMIGTVCNDETDRGGILENRNYRTKATFWTGLHDKNSKEIYEGDIISDKGGLWKVIFYKAGYWAKFIGGKEGIVPLDWRIETGKIIGNIYENAELLKGV